LPFGWALSGLGAFCCSTSVAVLSARVRGRRGVLREWLARQGDGCLGGAVSWQLRSWCAAARSALR
jgi:hypothetical protein